MADKHIKKCSKPLIFREMHFKTTRCHFIPIRMAISLKKKYKPTHTKLKVLRRMCRNWNPCAQWWECKMMEPVWSFLKSLSIELPCDPATYFWVYTPEK